MRGYFGFGLDLRRINSKGMYMFEHLEVDKQESKRIEQIYSDPKLHNFISEYTFDECMETRGPRGGKRRGRKRICHYCGKKQAGHADTLPGYVPF